MSTKKSKELKEEFQEELRAQLWNLFSEVSPKEAGDLTSLLFNGYLHSPYADNPEDRTFMLEFHNQLQTFFNFLNSSNEQVDEYLKEYQGISTDKEMDKIMES